MESERHAFHRFHAPWKSRKDGEIPTFPQRRRFIHSLAKEAEYGSTGVPWKNGNPKPGFPLSHRTDGLRRKEAESRELRTLTTRPGDLPKPKRITAEAEN
jgi:hypothetical protein